MPTFVPAFKNSIATNKQHHNNYETTFTPKKPADSLVCAVRRRERFGSRNENLEI